MNRLMKLTSFFFFFNFNHVCNCDRIVQVWQVERQLKQVRWAVTVASLSREMSHPLPIFIVPYRQPSLCFFSTTATTAPRCKPISRPAKLPLVVRVVLDLCSSAKPRLDLPSSLNLPYVLINTLYTVLNRQLSEAISLHCPHFTTSTTRYLGCLVDPKAAGVEAKIPTRLVS